MNKKDLEKQEKIIILAERVKLLFGFCADLIPDKEILKDVMDLSHDRVSTTMAMVPILGAFGMDYNEAEISAKIKARRSDALYDLILALEETEQWRKDFAEKRNKQIEGRNQIARALGL